MPLKFSFGVIFLQYKNSAAKEIYFRRSRWIASTKTTSGPIVRNVYWDTFRPNYQSYCTDGYPKVSLRCFTDNFLTLVDNLLPSPWALAMCKVRFISLAKDLNQKHKIIFSQNFECFCCSVQAISVKNIWYGRKQNDI